MPGWEKLIYNRETKKQKQETEMEGTIEENPNNG